MANEENKVAIEEWKHVQAVIARKSESCLKIRSWIYTIIPAVAIAFASNKIDWPLILLMFCMLSITTFFMLLEGVQAIEHHRAIARSLEIEKTIKGGATYIGPLLSEQMIRKVTATEIKVIFILNNHGNRYFLMPYMIIYIMIVMAFSYIIFYP